jgi:hypothetical protein
MSSIFIPTSRSFSERQKKSKTLYARERAATTSGAKLPNLSFSKRHGDFEKIARETLIKSHEGR